MFVLKNQLFDPWLLLKADPVLSPEASSLAAQAQLAIKGPSGANILQMSNSHGYEFQLGTLVDINIRD